jgi:Zn-dependent protease with chaperone function
VIQLLVIAIFISFHVHDNLGHEALLAQFDPWRVVVMLLGPLLIAWGLVHAAAARGAVAIDKSNSLHEAFRADRLAFHTRVVGIGWFVFVTISLGWLDLVRATVGDLVFIDEFIAALPALGLLIALWWSMEPVDRRLREVIMWRQLERNVAPPVIAAGPSTTITGPFLNQPLDPPHDQPLIVRPSPSRWRHVWANARMQMLPFGLPICLMSIWEESLIFADDHVRSISVAIGNVLHLPLHPQVVYASLHILGLIAIFITAPALIAWVWSRKPVPVGEARQAVEQVCARNRVRFRTPRVWASDGMVANAAVLGFMYPLRYLLFTDVLLDHLAPRQLEAARQVAHEVGHIRRHHIIWLGATVVTGLLASGLVLGLVQEKWRWGEESSSTIGLAASLMVISSVIRFVGRRFEWQADAFAAADLSTIPGPSDPSASPASSSIVTGQAAAWMVSALYSVGAMNGIPPNRDSWRHGSISERVRRLKALVGVEREEMPIDREVRRIKFLVIAILAACITTIVLMARSA